jgi:quinol monooxygenase YgiN
MTIAVTLDFSIDPQQVEAFLALIKSVAPDTRAYDGCRLFDIWTDQDKPGHVFFYELWDSRAQQEKYFAWRMETGLVEKLGPFMVAPPVVTYYNRFDG